jgi:hypothetical protein
VNFRNWIDHAGCPNLTMGQASQRIGRDDERS